MKAVSLSIQSSSRTIPNTHFTHQNFLIKDRVLCLAWCRSGENYRRVHSSQGTACLLVSIRMAWALLYPVRALQEPIGREQERVW